MIAHFNTGTCTVGGAVCSDDAGLRRQRALHRRRLHARFPRPSNTTLHTVSTSGVTSFSTFAVVHPDALAGGFHAAARARRRQGRDRLPRRVAGGQSDQHALPRQGGLPEPDPGLHRRRSGVRCGSHRGRYLHLPGERVSRPEPIRTCSSCTASGSRATMVRKPVPTSKDPIDAANGAALVSALTALGGTATGTKQNDVHFTTPLAAPTCTALRVRRGAAQARQGDEQEPARLRRARQVPSTPID